MKKFLKFLSYVLVAALASCLTLTAVTVTDTAAAPSKLDQLSGLIRERFIGEVDVTAMEDAAADAMVGAIGDRWSYYIPASEYQAHQDRMNNSYVGVGITVRPEEDDSAYQVLEVTKGGPAEEAGLLAGDRITAVDGVSVGEIGTGEATNRIRGEEGTTVVLTLERAGEVLSFTVERRAIQTVVATGQMLEGNVGLVTIENFDERCASETIAVVEKLIGEGAEALIFDVRNNPGGYKKELVKVLDYLLPEGPLFRSEYYDGTVNVDESDAKCLELPMAVLVNSESISAAEFFAAALDEYEAATVVGEQTIGKGYFQQSYKLSDGSAVGLSVGRYTTPKGVSLTDVGITPDVVVEVDDELFLQIYYGNVDWSEDPQVMAAMEVLKNAE